MVSAKCSDALPYLLYKTYIRFGNTLYRQIVGTPMGTNSCASIGSDLFLFCYERDFMTSLSDDNQTDIIGATSRYLDDVLNIGSPYFKGMVNQIDPPELQFYKAYTSATLDLHLSKRDDFEFDIVFSPFWMAVFHVVPRVELYFSTYSVGIKPS